MFWPAGVRAACRRRTSCRASRSCGELAAVAVAAASGPGGIRGRAGRPCGACPRRASRLSAAARRLVGARAAWLVARWPGSVLGRRVGSSDARIVRRRVASGSSAGSLPGRVSSWGRRGVRRLVGSAPGSLVVGHRLERQRAEDQRGRDRGRHQRIPPAAPRTAGRLVGRVLGGGSHGGLLFNAGAARGSGEKRSQGAAVLDAAEVTGKRASGEAGHASGPGGLDRPGTRWTASQTPLSGRKRLRPCPRLFSAHATRSPRR